MKYVSSNDIYFMNKIKSINNWQNKYKEAIKIKLETLFQIFLKVINIIQHFQGPKNRTRVFFL